MRHLFLFFFLVLTQPARAQVRWTELTSPALGRTVRYGLASTGPDAEQFVYVTDGQKWVDNGLWEAIEGLTTAGTVPPARYVFVSTLTPEGSDRRNEYFFANPDYLAFFRDELLPAVEGPTGVPRHRRHLVGISFGGLSAAYFAARDAPFTGYGLLSPITYPRREELHRRIAFGPAAGQRIFLSTGTHDAETYVAELLALYRAKDLTVKVVRTAGGHDFANWRSQLPALLTFLLSR